MDGIINVFKERGYTSHDVVARLRGITKERHIGHTGTLDPLATGVLPVCLGWATKVCDMLTDRSKVYETVLLLGVQSDSEDITGRVTATGDVSQITDEMIKEAISCFIGDIDQIPPMLSAKRVQGQRLYELAREGIADVERSAKCVHIFNIEIISDIKRMRLGDKDSFSAAEDSCLSRYPDKTVTEDGHWQWGEETIYNEAGNDLQVIRVALRIECEKGTYIRTICSDIGKKLGCFGCMEKLLRTRSGEFEVFESLRLEELEEVFRLYYSSEEKNQELIDKVMISPDRCFMEYPRLNSKEKYDLALHNGNLLRFRHFKEFITVPDKIVRVYDSSGRFCGVYEWIEERNLYKPLKMFC